MFNTFGCMYAGTFPMCLAGVTVYGNPLKQLIRARASDEGDSDKEDSG